MRYYFINQDSKEFTIDLASVQCSEFTFNTAEGNQKAWVKNLAGKNYISFDQVKWEKLPKLGVNETLVSHSEVYKVYRGYKPSGLFAGGAGAMLTQMPGKVVKVMVKDGDAVVKGQTVLILEAMKMENEIKAGVDGKIKNLNVKEGQAVEAGFLMMEIEA